MACPAQGTRIMPFFSEGFHFGFALLGHLYPLQP